MDLSKSRIDGREREAAVVGKWAPGVTENDAKNRLDLAAYLIERSDNRGGEIRVETVLVLPATNRTKEHTLRAVTIFRGLVVTSVLEFLTQDYGWSVFDTLPAGLAAEAADRAAHSPANEQAGGLREVQMQQLLDAAIVLS